VTIISHIIIIPDNTRHLIKWCTNHALTSKLTTARHRATHRRQLFSSAFN